MTEPTASTPAPAAAASDTEPDRVLFERRGALGLITLNRPRAINALTRDMIVAVHEFLDAALADDRVATIAIRGAGERGLCAGGDVAELARARLAAAAATTGASESGSSTASAAASASDAAAEFADRAARDFFWHEYRLNEAISRAAKPFVALMDGIVLGGGVGVSAHGSHRVVTERSKVGMPETGIGLFPDVGGTLLLGRAGGLGLRMALTGAPVGPDEAIAAGLADVLVPSERLDEFVQRLETEHPDAVLAALRMPGDPVVEPEWQHRLGTADTFDDALEVLRDAAVTDVQSAASASARAALELIETRSPTSLRVAFEAIRRARALPSLAEALRVEYRLAVRMTAAHDFAEGVRAQLIDKDRSPRWLPASLDAVDDAEVEAMFAPFDDADELHFD